MYWRSYASIMNFFTADNEIVGNFPNPSMWKRKSSINQSLIYYNIQLQLITPKAPPFNVEDQS